MRDIGTARRRRTNRNRKGYTHIPLEMLPERGVPLPSPVATGFGEGAIDPFLKFPVDLDYFGRELIVNSMLPDPFDLGLLRSSRLKRQS